jgi:hypothetical protein
MTGLIASIIILIIRKIRNHKYKSIIISISINLCFIVVIALYTTSHSTYYKYNDWVILQNSIYEVEKKYGDFDSGEIRENQRGKVGYYIYTDNGPIMPDHMEHFYYMEYDEKGVIYNVYDGCPPGG